jgi:hypothetical protein
VERAESILITITNVLGGLRKTLDVGGAALPRLPPWLRCDILLAVGTWPREETLGVGRSQMALDVKFEERPDYMLVSVSGEYDMEEAIERFAVVIAACRRLNLTKVLIDFRTLPGERAMVQQVMYAMGVGGLHQQHLSASGTPLRVAYVGDASVVKPSNPGLDVVKGYGMDALVTANLDEAVDWLSR